MLEPASIEGLIESFKEHRKVLAVGGQTKPSMSTANGAEPLSVKKLSGITQYDPSEFTFTALAGTTVSEVDRTLAQQGQYLPFDPCLVSAGATLGGTIASGISGAGRFRYGGVRDFLIGVRFVDGTGRLVAGGGRVVKNAAGFDTPKLMVGSLGRLGVLAEATFKVFPRPESLLTVKIPCRSHAEAIDRLTLLAGGRWELDALDYRAADRTLYARLGGPAPANDALAVSLSNELKAGAARMSEDEAAVFWSDLTEFRWVPPGATVAKIPLSPRRFLSLQELLERVEGCSLHLSGGGAFAWLSIVTADLVPSADQALTALGLRGIVLKGPGKAMWIGTRPDRAIDAAIKKVLDPPSRFPDF